MLGRLWENEGEVSLMYGGGGMDGSGAEASGPESAALRTLRASDDVMDEASVVLLHEVDEAACVWQRPS